MSPSITTPVSARTYSKQQKSQREVERSQSRHDEDVKEKNRLARVMEHKREFEERVVRRREAEYARLRVEREERLSQVLKARKEERDMKRKMLYYLRTEEERVTRLHEEEAQKRLGYGCATPEITSVFSESDDVSFMANMNPAKKLKQDPVNMVSAKEPLFQMPIFEESWGASSVDAFLNADATQDGGNEVDLWSFSELPAILDGSF
ncbi:putative eukaryotic translation initiation factor 3 subunit A [Helianthus annuus]|uniref:Eukaryotic translation initiation factor 3 subunit A n=1 Tax=Helianthus annuus TaxID=4232 RepID=A0A9K3HW52_HELAN|nr:putative eukaryotic translation initiation factor 3 subunit A [Helianthus annuus]